MNKVMKEDNLATCLSVVQNCWLKQLEEGLVVGTHSYKVS